jgi:hypothetical protein
MLALLAPSEIIHPDRVGKTIHATEQAAARSMLDKFNATHRMRLIVR